MCDGVVTEFVKLDDPADISNPDGVGRKTILRKILKLAIPF